MKTRIFAYCFGLMPILASCGGAGAFKACLSIKIDNQISDSASTFTLKITDPVIRNFTSDDPLEGELTEEVSLEAGQSDTFAFYLHQDGKQILKGCDEASALAKGAYGTKVNGHSQDFRDDDKEGCIILKSSGDPNNPSIESCGSENPFDFWKP